MAATPMTKRMFMTETQPSSETTPFWRFSLHFYRSVGVADACIALQDDCGVDVNLLLFLLWLRRRGASACQHDEVKELDDKVRDWRNLTDHSDPRRAPQAQRRARR